MYPLTPAQTHPGILTMKPDKGYPQRIWKLSSQSEQFFEDCIDKTDDKIQVDESFETGDHKESPVLRFQTGIHYLWNRNERENLWTWTTWL